MAKFIYTYRSSDGVRHEERMDAANRDTVFVALRERGIKAIKVIASDGTKANGEVHGVQKRIVIAIAAAVAIVAGSVAYWTGTHKAGEGQSGEEIMTITPQGPVVTRNADPLQRQIIMGNRSRIERAADEIFTAAPERFLARFAEPGRPLGDPMPEAPTETEFRVNLGVPIRVASNELTEYIDLKRIVTDIKREMRAYLSGGGSVDGYITELVKRQKMEIAYRESADKKLMEMVAVLDGKNKKATEEAYDYWLKANAHLQSMGIYPIVLPDNLRSYQMGLDITD